MTDIQYSRKDIEYKCISKASLISKVTTPHLMYYTEIKTIFGSFTSANVFIATKKRRRLHDQ